MINVSQEQAYQCIAEAICIDFYQAKSNFPLACFKGQLELSPAQVQDLVFELKNLFKSEVKLDFNVITNTITGPELVTMAMNMANKVKVKQ